MKGGLLLNRSKQVPAEDSAAFGGIAERFRRAGDLDRAIALCRDGLKKFPAMLSARVTLGWALLDKGEYGEARTELEQVLRRAPDNLAAIRGLAELHDRTAHMPDGSPAWHQEQQEALEDLAAAMEAAASSELAQAREALPIPITSNEREAFSTEPVLITAAEQAMAAVAAQSGSLAEERGDVFPGEQHGAVFSVAREAPLVVPMIAFEVDAPELFTDSLALDRPGITRLVVDEGIGDGTAPTSASHPAVHTQSLEFDVVELARTQSVELDPPGAARTQSLEFDPVQTTFAEERLEAFVGGEAAPADPLAEWNTEALDLDLAPILETIVTLPTTEAVELDTLATVFASPIVEDVPDCVLEVASNEFVSAEETVADLQASIFADELAAGMVETAVESAADEAATDLAFGFELREAASVDLMVSDEGADLPPFDTSEPVDTRLAALVSDSSATPEVTLTIDQLFPIREDAAAELVELPVGAFEQVTPVVPVVEVEEERVPVLEDLEDDVEEPVDTPIAAFAAVMPAELDERFPVLETGFVLPAPVQRHPALVPLERLLRQVQARRLELATASMA